MKLNQRLVIIILIIILSVTLIYFVLIDNYIIPQIISANQLSFQNGYESGSNSIILGIIQQSVNCQPISLYSGNDTIQIIDVACLQSTNSITNP